MAKVDLISMSAAQAAADIAQGKISAQDYTQACLDQIAANEPAVGAFIHLDPEHALAQARACDEYRQSGRPIGPLHGIPVGIKDIIDTADYPTECGTAMMAGRRPQKDAAVVTRLRAAGAIILGKTVTTEMAYFFPGKTKNPHDLARTPGGSSSGSAASVAAGMVPISIGSQTNGSVIRPGSFCGVYAMKPSHGLVSRAGVLPLSRTLDHLGPFARSLDDLALTMDAIAGYDPEDLDSRPFGARNFRQVMTENFPLAPRLAFVRTPKWDQADADTREQFEALVAELGDVCQTFDLPERYADGWESQRVIMAADMAHNLGIVADEGGNKVSDRFHALMADGRKVTATRYLAALAERDILRDSLETVFQQQFTAFITPAARGAAPKDLTVTGDPVFCTLWSLLGLPAITLPLLKSSEGMPVGVQLVGPMGDDARLMRTARWLVEKLG